MGEKKKKERERKKEKKRERKRKMGKKKNSDCRKPSDSSHSKTLLRISVLDLVKVQVMFNFGNATETHLACWL